MATNQLASRSSLAVMGAQQVLGRAVDTALSVQQPVIERHLRRTVRNRIGAPPGDVIRALERQYLATVTTTGAAVGGSAAAPGVGTGTALALSTGEIATFLEASAVLSLAIAELHGVTVDDLERRRTLVLAVLLGDSGIKVVQKAAGRTGQHWGRQITTHISMDTIKRINAVLGRNFVTKYGTKQGIIVIGRLAPFGVGAAIGACGNAVLGKTVVTATRRVFGPSPKHLPIGLATEV